MLHVKFFDAPASHAWYFLVWIVLEVEFQRLLNSGAGLLWGVAKAGDFHVQSLSHPFIIFLIDDNLNRALHGIPPDIPKYDESWLTRLYSIAVYGRDDAAE